MNEKRTHEDCSVGGKPVYMIRCPRCRRVLHMHGKRAYVYFLRGYRIITNVRGVYGQAIVKQLAASTLLFSGMPKHKARSSLRS